jgi:hypothetical protein
VQAHEFTGIAVAGTDTGHCSVFDPRTGRQEWQWQGKRAHVAGVATVPTADLCSLVLAYGDGEMSLLDLRRQGPGMVLAHVKSPAPITSVATDGCCALAGMNSGGVLVWNLDPASNQTSKDLDIGIPCTGTGMAFPVNVGGEGCGSIQCLSVSRAENGPGWRLLTGHKGGSLRICDL